MRWVTGTIRTLVLVAVAGCGLNIGAANAFPGIGESRVAGAVEPTVMPVSHRQHYWYWEGAWWRHGPWSDHRIQGMVVPRPWSTPVFVPWGAQRLRACAARYASFDPVTGTYVSARGQRRICR